MSSFTSCYFEQLSYRNRSLGSPSTSVSLPACHKGPRTVRYFGVIHEGTRDEVLKTFVLNREATKSHLDKDSSASLMHKNSNNLGSRITDHFNQEFPGVAGVEVWLRTHKGQLTLSSGKPPRETEKGIMGMERSMVTSTWPVLSSHRLRPHK